LTGIVVDSQNNHFMSENGVLYSEDQSVLKQYPGGIQSTVFTVPDNVTHIDDYAFAYNDSLTHINLPDSLAYIGEYAFYDCDSLVKVSIPENVTYLGRWLFSSCNHLAEVHLPENITYINDNIFAGCNALTGIAVPESVTNIGRYAFDYCNNMRGILFEGNAPDGTLSAGLVNLQVYFLPDAEGFTTPTWKGYPSYELEDIPQIFITDPADTSTVTDYFCSVSGYVTYPHHVTNILWTTDGETYNSQVLTNTHFSFETVLSDGTNTITAFYPPAARMTVTVIAIPEPALMIFAIVALVQCRRIRNYG
jgi:hypothetical protein